MHGCVRVPNAKRPDPDSDLIHDRSRCVQHLLGFAEMCPECARLMAEHGRLERIIARTTIRMNAVITAGERNADYAVLQKRVETTLKRLELLNAETLGHRSRCHREPDQIS